MDVLSALRAVEVLSDFDVDALQRLAAQSWSQDYSSGQLILGRGQSVESVGVVLSGRIEVRLGGDESPPLVVPEGQLFGEMSLLTGEPAVADVVAATSSRVLHLPHDALSRELARAPKAVQRLARLLAKRIAAQRSDSAEQAYAARAKRAQLGEDMKGAVLVLDVQRLSIRYALFRDGGRQLDGSIEPIAAGARLVHRGPAGGHERDVAAPDHAAALQLVFGQLAHPEHGSLERLSDLSAVGHRVFHGGPRFFSSTVVSAEVKEELRRACALAPQHNPYNLQGIELCEKLLPPGVPQVAVFDTAFHMTMPEHAYRYALPRQLTDRHQLRRFGFHGMSHQYASQTACAFLGVASTSLKIVTCHLGRGASVAAVEHGRSVDTSSGMTPLEGLIMGTRSGDVDPGLVLHLLALGLTREQVEETLNRESGLLGLSGLTGDPLELEKAADAGHRDALLALQAYCYRARKYVGAYAAAMGGIDVLVFTGRFGESAPGIRSHVCHGLGFLGILLDEEANRAVRADGASCLRISAGGSRVAVLVVPSDDERMIAAGTMRALKRSGVTEILQTRHDRPIPIGVSAHHVHLSQEHVEVLFGRGRHLTRRNDLFQPGQFACEEMLNLVGPKGRVERVRILGPVRPATQVEISRTEEFKLGIDAPVRASGDTKGSPGLTLEGPAGSVKLAEGVICALRHIHMSPEDALGLGLRDKDVVRIKVQGERSLIFGDVLVRVHPEFRLEMHIDTDEANAAQVDANQSANIESIQRRAV